MMNYSKTLVVTSAHTFQFDEVFEIGIWWYQALLSRLSRNTHALFAVSVLAWDDGRAFPAWLHQLNHRLEPRDDLLLAEGE